MRERSGPTPITSTREPGKRSSASASVPTPLSATSAPTNRPPARGSFMRDPAAAVFDLRRALGLLRLRRRLGLVDLDLHFARPRFFDLVFLFAASAAKAARSVEIPGGGGSSTHFFGSPCVVRPASMPSAFPAISS